MKQHQSELVRDSHNGSTLLGITHDASSSNGPASAIDRFAAETVMRMSGSPALVLELWDGTRIEGNTGRDQPVGTVKISDRSTLYALLTRRDVAFGDAYAAGQLTIDGDLVEVLEAIYLALRRAVPIGSWRRQVTSWLNRPSANSREAARENIHHHYDLGNDFYALWLDELMVYTCAYYPHESATLEQAQVAKLDHVCRKLQLRPGQSVVEAGCGWGALAIHMAQHYGVTVKAYNISKEQLRYARDRADREGVANLVEFIEDDYRSANGQFDAFVSIGMLEHVGVEHYENLGQLISRVLKPDGRGLLHSIGRNAPVPNNPWIERRIFPGSRPPALSEVARILEPQSLSVLDIENLRLHYATTCRAWLERFDATCDRVREMYDERFIRAWRLYLAGSVAGFTTGSLQLFQIVFAHQENNDVPLTREHLYGQDTANNR
jgi:cyclopropane-fatty-acyl-phospholipid synthase